MKESEIVCLSHSKYGFVSQNYFALCSEWIRSMSSCLSPVALCSGLPFSVLALVLGSVGALLATQDVGVPKSCAFKVRTYSHPHTCMHKCTQSYILRPSKHYMGAGWNVSSIGRYARYSQTQLLLLTRAEKCNQEFESLTKLLTLNCLTSTSPNRKIPPE